MKAINRQEKRQKRSELEALWRKQPISLPYSGLNGTEMKDRSVLRFVCNVIVKQASRVVKRFAESMPMEDFSNLLEVIEIAKRVTNSFQTNSDLLGWVPSMAGLAGRYLEEGCPENRISEILFLVTCEIGEHQKLLIDVVEELISRSEALEMVQMLSLVELNNDREGLPTDLKDKDGNTPYENSPIQQLCSRLYTESLTADYRLQVIPKIPRKRNRVTQSAAT